MLARGLIVLTSVSAVTAFAAPVPKALKAANKFDTARFQPSYKDELFDRVLEDFAEGTGLKWVGDHPALGTVSLKPNREYNGAELLDLLNEILEDKQYVLIRHAGTFYLHPSDQAVDLEKVDTVSADDILLRRKEATPAKPVVPGWGIGGGWDGAGRYVAEKPVPPKRGKTEVVTLVIELKGMTLADVRPQITKSLSKSGRVEADERGQVVRATDRVDNLRVVASILTDSGGNSGCGQPKPGG